MRFQLVGHVLKQTAQFNDVFFENGPAKAAQTLQPRGDGRAVVLDPFLVCIGQTLDETEAQNVVGQVRQVLERINYRCYQIIIHLYL